MAHRRLTSDSWLSLVAQSVAALAGRLIRVRPLSPQLGFELPGPGLVHRRVLLDKFVRPWAPCPYGFLFSVSLQADTMPGIDFRQLRATVTMAEVLQLLGFEPRSVRGSQWRGPCPIHGSAADSMVFSVNLAKNTFRCFKCGAAGNHLDLWTAVTKQPLFEAVLDLCRRLRREVPYLSPRTEKRNPY